MRHPRLAAVLIVLVALAGATGLAAAARGVGRHAAAAPGVAGLAVHVTGVVAPYKDVTSQVDVRVDRQGMAGTIAGIQVRVVGGKLYVRGVRAWSVYSSTAPADFSRLVKTVGSGWVRAPVMPGSSQEAAVEHLKDLDTLAGFVHRPASPLLNSPVPQPAGAVGPGIISYQLTLTGRARGTGDSAPAGARRLCRLKPDTIEIPGCPRVPPVPVRLVTLQVAGTYAGQVARVQAHCYRVDEFVSWSHASMTRSGAPPLSISGTIYPSSTRRPARAPHAELWIGSRWDEETSDFSGPVVTDRAGHFSGVLAAAIGSDVNGSVTVSGQYSLPAGTSC